MLNNLGFERAKEIVRLAKEARDNPEGLASDPQRGGAGGDDGVTRPGTPPEPQPADTWAHAFERYLRDLSDEAMGELVDLYKLGRGEDAKMQSGTSHAEQIDFLTSRSDLITSLEAALRRL
jgi:hypothetical protein